MLFHAGVHVGGEVSFGCAKEDLVRGDAAHRGGQQWLVLPRRHSFVQTDSQGSFDDLVIKIRCGNPRAHIGRQNSNLTDRPPTGSDILNDFVLSA